MHDLTFWSSLFGGALIGLAASLLLVASGQVAGVSGIIGNLLLGQPGDGAWRLMFLTGLLLAGLAFALLLPSTIAPSPRSLPVVALAGLLVGVGTRLGNGCTSGHGVCGMSRLSPRSLIATSTFVMTGMLTVTLVRWI